MEKKKATNKGSQSQSETHSTTNQLTSTNATTQKLFVLAYLRERPHSTNELRSKGIYYPPARVHELKQDGYRIETTWRYEYDNANILHRVGVYTLIGGVA